MSHSSSHPQSYVHMLASNQKFFTVGFDSYVKRAASNDDQTLPRASKGLPQK